MRIESVSQEIRSFRSDQSAKKKDASVQSGDKVEISTDLLAKVHEVSESEVARVQQARERIQNKFYDRPEILNDIADAILNSQVLEVPADNAGEKI
jgi:hypothetical protein